MKKKAIIVFLKYPELGKVKTRLASTTSKSFALEIYKSIAERLFEEISKAADYSDVYIFYSGDGEVEKLKSWTNLDSYYEKQIGDDLGEKISNALNGSYDNLKESLLQSIQKYDRQEFMKNFCNYIGEL